MIDANQYMVESKGRGERITHMYWAGESVDVKNILKGQKLNQEQYNKFKQTVEGILKITKEIDTIAKEHGERLNKNGVINKLETKITIGNICAKEDTK